MRGPEEFVITADHTAMKLGRIRPSAEQKARAVCLATYLTKPLPPAPLELHHANGAPIAMWGNDRYGDCTFAGIANHKAILSKLYGLPCSVTADEVIAAYLAFTGGVDEGAIEQDVLNRGQRDGYALGDPTVDRILGWAKVDLHDVALCRSAIALFGSLYLGVELPTVAQRQQVWDTGAFGYHGGDYAPGSWGGHCLLQSGWDRHGMVDLVTWGEVKEATPRWISHYAEEGYVLLLDDIAQAHGVDVQALLADVAALRAR